MQSEENTPIMGGAGADTMGCRSDEVDSARDLTLLQRMHATRSSARVRQQLSRGHLRDGAGGLPDDCQLVLTRRHGHGRSLQPQHRRLQPCANGSPLAICRLRIAANLRACEPTCGISTARSESVAARPLNWLMVHSVLECLVCCGRQEGQAWFTGLGARNSQGPDEEQVRA